MHVSTIIYLNSALQNNAIESTFYLNLYKTEKPMEKRRRNTQVYVYIREHLTPCERDSLIYTLSRSHMRATSEVHERVPLIYGQHNAIRVLAI